MLLNNNLIVCSAHLNEETENVKNQGTVSKITHLIGALGTGSTQC